MFQKQSDTLLNASPKKVALVFPMTVSWLSVLAEGVADYSRRHANWDFTTSPPTLIEAQEIAINIHTLKQWRGDGAIAVLTEPAEARRARQLGFPVVCIRGICTTAACRG